MNTREGMKAQTQTACHGCEGPTLYEVNSCKIDSAETSWTRKLYADNPTNAVELHHRVYPDERVIWVEAIDKRHSKCLVIISVRVPGLDGVFTIGVCQECDGGKA